MFLRRRFESARSCLRGKGRQRPLRRGALFGRPLCGQRRGVPSSSPRGSGWPALRGWRPTRIPHLHIDSLISQIVMMLVLPNVVQEDGRKSTLRLPLAARWQALVQASAEGLWCRWQGYSTLGASLLELRVLLFSAASCTAGSERSPPWPQAGRAFPGALLLLAICAWSLCSPCCAALRRRTARRAPCAWTSPSFPPL